MKGYKIMADSVMLNIGPNFDFNAFADRLAQMYAAQGFAVSVADINSAKVIKFEKETGGINTVLGLGVGITATCSIYNGVPLAQFITVCFKLCIPMRNGTVKSLAV